MDKKNKILTLYFSTTINNILITLTDINGNTIDWLSSGAIRFKGRQKASKAAVYSLSLKLLKKLTTKKVKNLQIIFKGNPYYRKILLKILKKISFLKISYMRDKTPIPHSGCRLSKERRK